MSIKFVKICGIRGEKIRRRREINHHDLLKIFWDIAPITPEGYYLAYSNHYQFLDMKAIMDLIGRMCISLIFFYEAYDSIVYAKATKAMMTEYGVVWRQDLLFYGAIVALVLGSILVLIGYRAGLGAFLLLAYWIPVTLIVHSFWNDAPELRRMESIHFMKNIAIAGGLLSVLVNGSGKISIRRLFATFRVRNA